MRVHELLKSLSTEEVIEKLITSEGFFDEVDWDNRLSEEKKKQLKEFITKLYVKELEKIKNNKYNIIDINDCILITTKDIGGNHYSSGKLYKEDFESSKKFDINKPEEFKNPLVSIIFENRIKILGMEISNSSIERYGKVTVAASLFKEMCMFGIDNEARELEIKIKINELEEAAKEAETLNPEDYIKEDDLFSSLGFVDERTEEEKERSRQKAKEDAINYITEVINVILDTIQKYE